MTDFRALCAELIRVNDDTEAGDWCRAWDDVTDRARAALAEQPVAIGPEWQPCVKLPITVHVREQRPGETHTSTREGITPLRHDDLIMRGVQGEEYPIGRELFEQTYRMGTPELEGPTHKELWELYDEMGGEPEHGPWVRDFARAVLARWGQPAATPIPVAERLPGPEDLNGILEEYWWHDHACWYLDTYQANYTHWLPVNALPLPAND